jgi:hypothetical protein
MFKVDRKIFAAFLSQHHFDQLVSDGIELVGPEDLDEDKIDQLLAKRRSLRLDSGNFVLRIGTVHKLQPCMLVGLYQIHKALEERMLSQLLDLF